MPFKSENQRRYMWSQHPDIAEKWAHGEHSSSGPHRMPKRKSRKSSRQRRRK